MKIVKLKKIDDALYEITYNTFWRKNITRKIFPSVFSFRYSDTGRELPFQTDLSVKNLAFKMDINEVKVL